MDVLWLIPIGLLAFACCLGATAYLRNARDSQLAQLEPVMFPHPHPRPPLPPSRISSLTKHGISVFIDLPPQRSAPTCKTNQEAKNSNFCPARAALNPR